MPSKAATRMAPMEQGTVDTLLLSTKSLELLYTCRWYLSCTNSVLITALAILVLILSVFHPYKERFYNQLDVFFFVCMMPFISSLWYLQGSATLITLYSDRLIVEMLAPIPIIYPLCLVLYHTWRKSRRLQRVTKWIRAFLPRSQDRRWADSLPCRVILDEASGLLNQERQQ